ncbi:MAG: phospholipase/carboxylesterase [Acidobacteriota bacterium]|jgi:phospholipase/carboxylesterase|nr:phospholipase/carboxylesterase [Acidobacteriota bacterium]
MSLLYTAHVPAGDGPFPAIVAIHGWGANAHDLLGLAPLLHGGRAIVLCPQGPVAVPFGNGEYGYGWFPLRTGAPPDVVAFQRAAEALREFVDQALRRFPIDPKRVVLAGFSQGGVMGYELALSQPSRFAGLAALSTWFPPELAQILPKLPEQEGFPVLVIHGTRDNRISVEQARESREALRPYGVALTYREFDMGHEIRQDALRVVLQWLDGKVLKEE